MKSVVETGSFLSSTVVICTRNRPDMIGDVLRDLEANDYPAFRVLVVDQSTDEETRRIVEELQAEWDQLDYLPTATVGLSVSRNLGLKHATGDIIIYTDDDCRLPSDWVASAVAEFAADPDLNALLGRTLPTDQEPGKIPVSIHPSLQRHVFDRFPNLLRINIFRLGGGNNMALRRKVVERVGWFDENKNGTDDVDYIYRILAADVKLVYSPRVLAYHRAWRTPQQVERLFQDYDRRAGWVIVKHLHLHTRGAWRFAASRVWFHIVRPLLGGLVQMDSHRIRRSWIAAQATWLAFRQYRSENNKDRRS